MISSQSFAKEIAQRKYSTVSLLLSLFLAVSAANLIQVAVKVYTAAVTQSTVALGTMIFNISGLVVFLLFLYARFFLLKRSYSVAFSIFLLTSNLAATLVMFLTGIANWIVFVLLVINILSCSIVTTRRYTFYIMILSSAIILLVSFLHNSGLVAYSPENTSSFLSNTFIGVILLYVIYRITTIGYGEIEHSYEQAYKYSAALEELNQELDNLVKKRTQQLESSHEREMQSLYAAAVFGRISKSLVHDIATPLSTIAGSLSMLKDEKLSENQAELVGLSAKAISQIDRLMTHSQSIVAGSVRNEEFNVNSLVRNLLGILRHQFLAYDIKANVEIPSSLNLYGSSGIFERVLLNLLTNAIDAINSNTAKNNKREINILAKEHPKGIVVEIEDTGIGISEAEQEKIFEADYSSKQNKGKEHMGMGLYFVYQSLTKYFNGYVEVKSAVGKGTTFELYFESATSDNASDQHDEHIDPESHQLFTE